MPKRNLYQIFLAFLFLAVFPFAYLCFFVNPSSDDFGFAGQMMHIDYLDLLSLNYFKWNGRYISNCLIFLNPIVCGNFMGYKLVPLGLMILLFLANYFVVSSVLRRLSFLIKIIFSLCFGLLFLHGLPTISQGLYWYTGAVIYFLGIVVFIFYLGLFFRVWSGQASKYCPIVLSLLLIISCGFNEVLTLLILFSLALVTVVSYVNDLTQKKMVLVQLAVAIVVAGIMIFSPGNTIRGVSYEGAHQLLPSVLYGMAQALRFSMLWAASIPLIAASIVYCYVNRQASKEIKAFKHSFYINRWLSLLILLIIPFLGAFPAYWATGILGQHRTLNVAYFFFLIMWFINLTAWFNYYTQKRNWTLNKRVLLILLAGMVLGFLTTGNGGQTWSNIFSGEAQRYDEQLSNRFEILTNNSSKGPISLPAIRDQPSCLFVPDLSEDPKNWNNKGYVYYFQTKTAEVFLERERK